jgi:hypothetical protein
MGMKISKMLAISCALAAGSTFLTVRAEDNAAQAAARSALAKQLFDMNAQQSSSPAPVTADANVAMKPVSSKEAKAKAKMEKAAAEAKAKQEAEDLKAKQAAEQKLALQQAADAKATAAAPAKQEEQVEAERAALAAAQANRAAANDQAKTVSQPAINSPSATVATPAPAKTEKPAKANQEPGYIGKDLGMKPIATPALPISATKEQQLQALLAKYKADQISPEEYHKQRAAILAEP